MEIGEIVGILFLFGLLAVFGLYVYRENCCPECGGFRSIERVEAEYTPVDDKTDGKDIIWHLMTEGEHRTKSSIIKWVDRCKICGCETEGERLFRHY
jgi:hypothetical protein